jgi:hypothetical protein
MNIGHISLVLSPNVLQKLWENKARYRHLPEPGQIVADFQELGRRGGVPAAITMNKGKAMLLLYTSSYYLATYPTERGDGYRISYIDPLDLHEHERLGKGVLMLQAPYCNIVQRASDISSKNNLWPKNNYWDKIQQAWQALEKQRRQSGAGAAQEPERLTPVYENYLNTISTLVEVTHKLEQDKHKLPTLIPYRLVESTGEERYMRDIYTFHLAGSPQVDGKNLLRLKEAPDLQGRVFGIQGNKLTIKFESAIDRAHIPNQGNFEPIVGGAIYRTQQEAIKILREGEAKNKHLLHILVDRHYQHYQRDDTALPAKSLNPEQLKAFRHALTVPDMLLVLGPPGTGKTRTITAIAHQCATRHQRVLVTSRTHKAVDNVLEQLPDNLTVVRFGHEDRIAENIRSKLIDEQAKEMQQTILQRTTGNNQKLANFIQHKSVIDQWVAHLQTLFTQLNHSEQRIHDLRQLCAYAVQRVEAPYKPRIDELTATLQNQQAALSHSKSQIEDWTQKRATAESRSKLPVIGAPFKWQADYYQKRLEKELTLINQAQSIFVATNQEYTTLQGHVQSTLATDSEYQRCIANIRQIEDASVHVRKEAGTVVNRLQGTIQDLMSSQKTGTGHDLQSLQQYTAWFNQVRPLLESRSKLLYDWRKELETRTEQLTPELLRYADVVGATCIGVATAKDIADIEFDLAIVDEAGQICLPDLLVPLVRARRSILVGDHHQLPPFVDSEVQTWLDSLSPQTQQSLGLSDEETDSDHITRLLTRSAFEHLFTDQAASEYPHRDSADQIHTVRFIEQRRMPQVIADFASRHFYSNQLRTSGDDKLAYAEHKDPLFLRPLVLIDTSSEPFKDRREVKRTATESWGIAGFTNQLEAILIARIAALYEQESMEWVVIVPYRAQAQLIIQQLSKRIEAHDFKLEERVSTVDSFQGGERDKVIYGFTRSNNYGGVGFLKELRRLNVAMTRAKQQLVLIGDLSTLTHAGDDDFRKVALSLQEYTQNHGELLAYNECQKRLPFNS